VFGNPPLDFCLGALTSNKLHALEHELAQAAIIQRALLPRRTSPFNGWQVHYHYAPTGPVGGDCCDLFEYNCDLLFLLGDVSGKGLAASLLMSHVHGTFRALANTDCPLDSMLEAANHLQLVLIHPRGHGNETRCPRPIPPGASLLHDQSRLRVILFLVRAHPCCASVWS